MKKSGTVYLAGFLRVAGDYWFRMDRNWWFFFLLAWSEDWHSSTKEIICTMTSKSSKHLNVHLAKERKELWLQMLKRLCVFFFLKLLFFPQAVWGICVSTDATWRWTASQEMGFPWSANKGSLLGACQTPARETNAAPPLPVLTCGEYTSAGTRTLAHI